MTLIWLSGLLRRQGGRLVGTACGVALGVALLATIGAFVDVAKATMTQRAASDVAVDWQVQVANGSSASTVQRAVAADPALSGASVVQFAPTTGFTAITSGTRQQTGPGVVLGLPANYATSFPGSLRLLAGVQHGVVLAQQTAANLHAAPGDLVRVGRPGQGPVWVRIAGVVDLPQADSLFQTVGAPPQSQPAAPPDNVMVMPTVQFQRLMSGATPGTDAGVTTQVHARYAAQLPADPASAYSAVVTAAHHLEAQLSGAGVVGNNLAAALDGARQDALYSQILFLFLGLPGAVLAGILTAVVAAAATGQRRRDQALLRTRGAPAGRVVRLAVAEGVLVGAMGAAGGLLVAAVVARTVLRSGTAGSTGTINVAWSLAAAFLGMAIAVAVIAIPAARAAREQSVAGALQTVDRARSPLWMRLGLDGLLLAGSLVVFWLTSRSGYTLVLAPEGVASISVSYWAFLGPALLWLGLGLLAWRIVFVALGSPRVAAWLVRPIAGNLTATVASSLSRQRRLAALGVVMVALALSFAASTAIFNATYRTQAEVDAQLTNGADVAVTVPAGAPVDPGLVAQIRAVPGVVWAEPMLHRFAYIGSDLQDLFGISPTTITKATSLPDAYFTGGTSGQLMQRLAQRPDAILVSAETVKDYLLAPGDLVRLRLVDNATHQFVTVPFHYAGVANEFPTAPHDSFFVANATYVAQQTGSAAIGTVLVNTGGNDPQQVAAALRSTLGTTVHVTDITQTRATVGSSLTSVDLRGLTRIELLFALALAAAAGGLVLALGLAQRRRTFAIASVLGASRHQLRRIVLSEVFVIIAGGLVMATLAGWLLSAMLVKVLTGVFDPPPAGLTLPVGYLGATIVIATVTLVVAALWVARAARRPPVEALREG